MVYFADIQLDPEKLKNRQILLASLSISCYYWTSKDKHDLAVPAFYRAAIRKESDAYGLKLATFRLIRWLFLTRSCQKEGSFAK
jgi:hypothetical protein